MREHFIQRFAMGALMAIYAIYATGCLAAPPTPDPTLSPGDIFAGFIEKDIRSGASIPVLTNCLAYVDEGVTLTSTPEGIANYTVPKGSKVRATNPGLVEYAKKLYLLFHLSNIIDQFINFSYTPLTKGVYLNSTRTNGCSGTKRARAIDFGKKFNGITVDIDGVTMPGLNAEVVPIGQY